MGVVVVASTLYMHGRASKGSMGLDGGLLQRRDRLTGCNMHRLRSADLCIDRQDGRKDKDDDDDSNVAQHYCIAVDVIWCKWRFTCNTEDSCRGKSCASKHASPTLATLLGPRYVHELKVEASGWQRHHTVAPRCNFPVINNHTFHSVYGYIPSDYPFRSIHHRSIMKLL